MGFRRFAYTLLGLLAKVLPGLSSFFVYLLPCFFFWEIFVFLSVFEDLGFALMESIMIWNF